MRDPIAYTWDAEKKQVVEHFVELKRHCLGHLMLDMRYPATESRYGKFEPRDGWVHVPLKDFPKEFQMHLLIMGVS